MTEKRAVETANECLRLIRAFCPVHTGNLVGSVKLEFGDGFFRIYVDEDTAPYMPYTNEPWISPKWHGRKNPNLYWFDDGVSACFDYMETAFHGILKKEDTPDEEKIRSDLEALSQRITYANYTVEDLNENSLALSQRGDLSNGGRMF